VVVLLVLRRFKGLQEGEGEGGREGGRGGEEGTDKGGGGGGEGGRGRAGGREEGKLGLAGVVDAEDEVVGGMEGGREGGQAQVVEEGEAGGLDGAVAREAGREERKSRGERTEGGKERGREGGLYLAQPFLHLFAVLLKGAS